MAYRSPLLDEPLNIVITCALMALSKIYLSTNGLIKVLVLLDERLHIITLRVRLVRRQKGLPARHPVLGLLRVAVEELQLQALVQRHAARYPRPTLEKKQYIFILK